MRSLAWTGRTYCCTFGCWSVFGKLFVLNSFILLWKIIKANNFRIFILLVRLWVVGWLILILFRFLCYFNEGICLLPWVAFIKILSIRKAVFSAACKKGLGIFSDVRIVVKKFWLVESFSGTGTIYLIYYALFSFWNFMFNYFRFLL